MIINGFFRGFCEKKHIFNLFDDISIHGVFISIATPGDCII